jgi:diguanylate cyclase (GGDEF)-like protein
MRATFGYQDPRIRKIKYPGNSNYAAQAVHQGKPLIFHDLSDDPSTVADVTTNSKEVQSVIVAPLILKGQVLGAISLDSPEADAFDENDLRLLASFAATATAAIHNSRLHHEVQKMAITDELTGLYNRRGFYELGHREVERSRRFQRPLVAIMMDIDHFKRINDTYGHPVGDQVLAEVAKRCKDNLRRIDILGRLGGDEFTVLLPETDMFTGSRVAERLRLHVSAEPIITDGDPLRVSLSMGIAKATATTPDLDVLISRADSAMYRAKEKGRNRVEFG